MNERLNHCDYPEYGDTSCTDMRGRLYIKQVSSGIVWFCHDCGQKGFIREGCKSPTDTVKNVINTLNLSDLRLQTVKEISLPSDFSLSTIPPEGIIWLNKYQITMEEQQQFCIGYSESYKRLILPVFDNSKLVYWQGRFLKKPDKNNPKYLNIRQGGAKDVYFKRFKNTNLDSNLGCSVCIVEDILSAIKVGRYVNSIALLGSYFPPSIVEQLKDYDKVYIHLDLDKYKEAIKASKRINQLTGKSVSVIKTELDPKELSEDQLKLIYLF